MATLKKQLEESAKEKQELLISHSKEVISLRQEIVNLKIIKQRKQVLEEELKAEKRQNEDRRRELEKERTRRRAAEKWVKEIESGITGKSTEELETEKQNRRKTAEKLKENFLNKKCEDSSKMRKRDQIDEDEWWVQRGVVVERPSSKRSKINSQKRESVGPVKAKHDVEREGREEKKLRQHRSIANDKVETGMLKETGDGYCKLKIESSTVNSSYCKLTIYHLQKVKMLAMSERGR